MSTSEKTKSCSCCAPATASQASAADAPSCEVVEAAPVERTPTAAPADRVA